MTGSLVSDKMLKVRFSKSASKHRISHDRAAYIVQHCGLVLPRPPPANTAEDHDERLVFLGDDWHGNELEVVAIENAEGDLLVIHAMKLQDKYRADYNRVRGYQR